MPTTRNRHKEIAAGPAQTYAHSAECTQMSEKSPAKTQPCKQQDGLQQQFRRPGNSSGLKRKGTCELPPRPKKQKGASVTFAEECSALESQCLEPAPLPQLKCKVRAPDTVDLACTAAQTSSPTQNKSPAAEPKTPATADRHKRFSGAELQFNDSKAGTSPSDERWFDPRDPQKVNKVKGVLHTSHTPAGGRPLSREEQVQSLSDHLRACLLAGEGGSLYVSGLPGTGKTLTVHAVVRACCQDMAVQGPEAATVLLSINCMTLPSAQAVFGRLLDGVQAAAQLPLKPLAGDADPFIQPGGSCSSAGESSAGVLKELKTALGATQKDAAGEHDRRQSIGGGRRSSVGGRRGRRMIVAVLDEMDQLISQDQSVLYELFTLATLKGSRLVLVGIANSIDLTARVLPRLQSLARRPQLVTFPSYSAPQLEALLHQRLACLPGPVFHPQAIRLVAKKTASRSGDMRQVLDACAAAIDIVVQEAAEAAAAAEPCSDEADSEAAQKPLARIGINPMFKAISQLQGGGSAAVVAVKGLPPQQQLLLCAAANLIGDAAGGGAQTPLKGTPSRRLSGFGCATPMSAGNKRRLSFGFSEGAGTPGRVNMSRRLSTASDASSGSGLLPRKHDCILGELHSAYEDLCKKVGFKALAPSEVSAACSTLADMGLLGLGHAREERQRRVTLRMAISDIALALADARLIRSCLNHDTEISA